MPSVNLARGAAREFQRIRTARWTLLRLGGHRRGRSAGSGVDASHAAFSERVGARVGRLLFCAAGIRRPPAGARPTNAPDRKQGPAAASTKLGAGDQAQFRLSAGRWRRSLSRAASAGESFRRGRAMGIVYPSGGLGRIPRAPSPRFCWFTRGCLRILGAILSQGGDESGSRPCFMPWRSRF